MDGQPEISEAGFDAGAVELNVARGPANGPKLLLLHGATSRWQSFAPVIPDLSRDFSLVIPDQRGSGGSGRVAGAYGVRDLAQDVLALVDAEPGGMLDFVGHSFGGHIALCVAAARPERVRRLILEDCPLMAESGRLAARPAGPNFGHWLEVLRGHPDFEALLVEVAEYHSDMNEAARQGRAESLMALDPDLIEVYVNGAPFTGYDPHELAGQVQCPVLVLQADPSLGSRIDDAAAQLFCDLVPSASRKVMTGAGHGIHTDRPEDFADSVRAFLDH